MKFAVIGNGRMAKEHINAIKYLDGEVPLIFTKKSRDPYESLYKSYTGLDSQAIARKIEEFKYIDGIVVAVDWINTFEILKSLLNVFYGKMETPILVEKPVCFSLKEMESFYQFIVWNNVMVGYNRRFYSFIPNLKKAIADGTLLSVEVSLPEKLRKYNQQGIRKVYEYPLLYSASHVLDLLLYLLGPLEVNHTENVGINIHALLSRKENPNCKIHFQANFDANQIPRVAFNFNDNQIVLSPIEQCKHGVAPFSNISYDVGTTLTFGDKMVNSKAGIIRQMEYFIKRYINKEGVLERIGATLKDAENVIKLSEELMKGVK